MNSVRTENCKRTTFIVFDAIHNTVEVIEERNGSEEPPELVNSSTFTLDEADLPY